jgi:hypothetical protein
MRKIFISVALSRATNGLSFRSSTYQNSIGFSVPLVSQVSKFITAIEDAPIITYQAFDAKCDHLNLAPSASGESI